MPNDAYTLNLNEYPGGVGLWGAVPPLYDTTRLPLDRGIHVHARRIRSTLKDVDTTVSAVRLVGGNIPERGVHVSELDAISYMVCAVLSIKVRHIVCSLCQHPHLDQDWYSVHRHIVHRCESCGNYFRDSVYGIGNPIRGIQKDYNLHPSIPRKSSKELHISQRDFPGGIQIWGSNPAFIWSSNNEQEEGIHIHAFKEDDQPPYHDDTYSKVTIDGISLDADMVRTLMAQRALCHLEGRIVTLICKRCLHSEFSIGREAYTPVIHDTCSVCFGTLSSAPTNRALIGNPLFETFISLEKNAIRSPQEHQTHHHRLIPRH